jgi:hypothetical protein
MCILNYYVDVDKPPMCTSLRTPNLLVGFNCESKGEKVEAHSLICNTLGVGEHAGAPRTDYED